MVFGSKTMDTPTTKLEKAAMGFPVGDTIGTRKGIKLTLEQNWGPQKNDLKIKNPYKENKLENKNRTESTKIKREHDYLENKFTGGKKIPGKKKNHFGTIL